MELSSSSTPKKKKLNESKEAATQPEFSGPKRMIEPKHSKRKKKINLNCNVSLQKNYQFWVCYIHFKMRV